MISLEDTKATLGELIAFPTISSDSNLELADYLAARLNAAGARLETWHDASGRKVNLLAQFGPVGPAGVLLSAHTDVVPVTGQAWSSDPFSMREEAGRLYGRGSCDMKGFIACCLSFVESLPAEDLMRPLWLSLTYDEEVGCLGAQDLIAELEGRWALPAVAIVGEPTEMRIVDAHKGCFEYTTRFLGLEGHGSAPDLGVNAIDYAVRFAAKLQSLQAHLKSIAPADSPFEPAWTTLNLGRLTGGTARNVIANQAELEWEMRPVQSVDHRLVKAALDRLIADELLPSMRQVYAEASIETEVIGEVAGLERVPDNQAVALATSLLGANAVETVPFGTEAGLFQSLGMHVVVCGPGSIEQAHKADEYISLDQLQACCSMLDRLGHALTAG